MDGTGGSRTCRGSPGVTRGWSFTLPAFSCSLFSCCFPSGRQMLSCPGGRSFWQGKVRALGRGWFSERGMTRKLTEMLSSQGS